MDMRTSKPMRLSDQAINGSINQEAQLHLLKKNSQLNVTVMQVVVFKVCQTQSADLSVFVLFFLFFIIIKVSDFSRKPFCFRSVFYYYYFTFFLLQLHRPVISSSILNGFTSNFQDIIIMTRQCTV